MSRKPSQVLPAANAALAAESNTTTITPYLSVSCLNCSKCWHIHCCLSLPPSSPLTHTQDGGDKWRGVKIHHCFNTTLTGTSSSLSSRPLTSPHHPHPPLPSSSLALSLFCKPASFSLWVRNVSVWPHHFFSFISPSTSSGISGSFKCLFFSLLLLLLFLNPLSWFGCFGFLRFFQCVYFCSVCANRWGRSSEGSLFPLFSVSHWKFWYTAEHSEKQKKKKKKKWLKSQKSRMQN